MIGSDIRLALGTVQFGTCYGIAGRDSAVPSKEVKTILDAAWSFGLTMLDTAPAYGNIEARLVDLAGRHPFNIVSKIPAIAQRSEREARRFVRETIRRSRRRLGAGLKAMLFHDADDLLRDIGDAVWETAYEETRSAEIRLGVSCYSPYEAAVVRQRYPIAVAQVPGSALDQRLRSDEASARLAGVDIHLRSAFLQGLLLLPKHAAAERVPAAAAAISSWAAWCDENGLSPLRAALCVVKSLPDVRYCVVGVDRLAHLEQIVAAWNEARPVDAASLSTDNEDVIDPRRWQSRQSPRSER